MFFSTSSGETTYSLKDAIELRNKITRHGEACDQIRWVHVYCFTNAWFGLFPSRKIEMNGITKNPSTGEVKLTISKRQSNLQLAIRRSVVSFLREYMLGLPELPDEQTLQVYRDRHTEIIQKRVAFEKELALREQRLFNKTGQSMGPVIVHDEGFVPEAMANHEATTHNDPILQQINIIKNYIDQAKRNHRYDDVKILSDNLRELEIEYYFNQENQPASTASTSNDVLADTPSNTNPFDELWSLKWVVWYSFVMKPFECVLSLWKTQNPGPRNLQ